MYDLSKFVCLDVEADGLDDYTKIHIICLRDEKDEVREIKPQQCGISRAGERLREAIAGRTVIGHNILQFDIRVIKEILDVDISSSPILDTLVLSRLLRYDLAGGHSLESWGERLGIKKIGTDITDWSKLTDEMVQRCHSDTRIPIGIVNHYRRFLVDPNWDASIQLEHHTASVCELMHETGFPFDVDKAKELYGELFREVQKLDQELLSAFPPIPKPDKEITPKLTKSGTFSLSNLRWFDGDFGTLYPGAPFTRLVWEEFNPGSPRQIVDRLNKAGWKPTDKTKGHQEALKLGKKLPPEKREFFEQFGWKVSEENLSTLPDTAPEAAKTLRRRIVLASRLSDLEEWLNLCKKDSENVTRIYGHFNPIGAWTHRLSHAKPNLANIPVADHGKSDPSEFEIEINRINDTMRSLFGPRPNYRLIGTDADGLQMRVFAHYVNDPDLTRALVEGKKENGTDIHSLHQRKLGEPCKSRQDAKTFIYAWLLGAGVAKVAAILGCSFEDARRAVENFIESYPGLAELKRTIIPRDASKGFFVGLDGRKVVCDSEHLMLAGYLQNGEAIIMKGACREWMAELRRNKIDFELYTWPHDEWQTGVPDDSGIISFVQRVQIDAIRHQADRLNLNCPLEGSSDVGNSWLETH